MSRLHNTVGIRIFILATHIGLLFSESSTVWAIPTAAMPDRPICAQAGSDQEGWYWRNDAKVIQFGPCSKYPAATCGAIGTRSEGWYSEGWDLSTIGLTDLVIWDRWCHREVGLSLVGESCGAPSNFSCVSSLFCVNGACAMYEPTAPLTLSRVANGEAFGVTLGQEILLQLDRGPVHPCYGGEWQEASLVFDPVVIEYLGHDVIANLECPVGLAGCHHDLDQFKFRVRGRFERTQLALAMELAPAGCETSGQPRAKFTVSFHE